MGPDAAQSYVMVDDLASNLKDEIAVQVGNLDPAYCFQCGV